MFGMKSIRDAVRGEIFLTQDDLKLLDTVQIQRLRQIRQIGMAQLMFPGATHTMFEHSIGVLGMTTQIASYLLSREEYDGTRDALSAAAIFHDSGCYPFSRALSQLSLPSEKKNSVMIAREAIDNTPEISISGKEVARILDGRGGYLSDIIDGPFGADKLDLLQRDVLHTGISYGSIDTRIFSFFTLWNRRLAIFERAIPLAEAILFAMYMIRSTVYDHKMSISASGMLVRAVEHAMKNDENNEHPILPEELMVLNDSELMSRLKRCGDIPCEIVKRLENRDILRLAGISRREHIPVSSFPELAYMTRQKRLSLEERLAEKANLKPFEVIIDSPPVTDYEFEWAEIPVVSRSGANKNLGSLAKLAVQIAGANRDLWAIRLFAPKENGAEVKRIFERTTGIPLFSPSISSIEKPKPQTVEERKVVEQVNIERTYYGGVEAISGLNEISSVANQYRRLINENAEESTFQKFFEENPTFLELRVKATFPKKSLGGESFPDFLLVLHDYNYLVVEIEKPGDRLFTRGGDRTSKLSHAEHQIIDYLRWANEDKEFLRKRGCPNISSDNTRGLVVIGKNSDLNDAQLRRLESINATVRGRYEIKTFDGILIEYEAMLANITRVVQSLATR
jgi:HD superfamily phosphohydrolase